MEATSSTPCTVTLRFEQGTIVAEGPRSLLSGLSVPGLLWDPRIAAFRVPAFRHRELAAALAGTSAAVEDALAGDPPRRIAVTAPELRPYQRHALEAWAAAGHRGLAVLPTGSGKTVLAICAMAALRVATLVLVPTRVLLGQWVEQIARHTGRPVGVVGDGERRVERVTVTTFESAYRHMDAFGHRFGLLVVDEAHHFGGGVRAEALEACPAPARLGLTATPPERAEELGRLRTLIGPVVCTYTVPQLAGTHLAPYDLIRLHLELCPDERAAYVRARGAFDEAYRAFRRAGGSARWADFVQAASVTASGREALRGFHEARRIVSTASRKLRTVAELVRRHRDERTLVFTLDNAAAYALSRRLLFPAITCDIKRPERARVLADLRAGRVRSVVSARVLNEGIDLPEARVGIIVGGTATTREQVQRVGRLLRPAPGKRAVVYELVARDTFEETHAHRRQRCLVS